jgi:hypothetical protein
MFRAIFDSADAPATKRRRRKLQVDQIVYTFSVGYHANGIVRRKIAAIVNVECETVRLDPGCCYGCEHVFGPRDYTPSLREARDRFRAQLEADLAYVRNQAEQLSKRLLTLDGEKVVAAYVPSPPQLQRSHWYLPD